MATSTDLDGLIPGDEIPKNVPTMVELGATGLKRNAGFITEEFLPQLKGRRAIQIFKEMSENDPTVGALLFATDRLVRQVDWRVEPADSTPEAKEAAKFVEECMDDMSMTWDETCSEILTMLPFGWSWHEIVYKKRVGPWERDPKKRSKFTDGKIGWRKIPIRAQETMTRWIFDSSGGIRAMVQMAPPTYETKIIPIEKSLLFRVSSAKGNPEGRSFLRNAYEPWFYKKRLQEIEAIGAERDLAGLPIARVPAEYFTKGKNTPEGKMLEAFKTMVKAVRRNEQEGLVIPQHLDGDTKNPEFDFSLLGSGGSRQFDINGIIQRYEQRILMTVLADFIMVGHEGTGSYSLHTDKTGLFRASMNTIVQTIADTFNRYAIPRLFELNGWKVDALPQLIPGDIDPPDLAQLSAFLGQTASAGMQWFPDPELEKFLRQAARLPKLDETAEAVRETEARQQQILTLAQQRIELLQVSQSAEQGSMQLEQQRQQLTQGQMQLEQGQEQANPDVQAAGDSQTVQSGELDLEAKEQQLRHSEEMHQVQLEQAKAAGQGEDPRFAEQQLKQNQELHQEKVGQLKDQRKVGQLTAAEKLKQMKSAPKLAMKRKTDQPKGKT